MKVTKNKVVHMHFTLKDDNDNVIDSSQGQEPLAYIHGIGNIIPGLETGLEDKVVGDKVLVEVTPEDAYGEIDENMVQAVPKSGFQGSEELKEGMQVQIQTNEGVRIATVTKIVGEDVTLDLNHPLAGMNLNFDIEIMEIRDATQEELDHGHVHGPGGHQH